MRENAYLKTIEFGKIKILKFENEVTTQEKNVFFKHNLIFFKTRPKTAANDGTAFV